MNTHTTLSPASAALQLVAHRMPESMCFGILRELRHCSIEDEAPALRDADLAGDDGSAEFRLIMCAVLSVPNFNAEAPIWRAQFFGGPAGPQIVLYEEDTDMVHLIVPLASEALVKLAKRLLNDPSLTRKAA